MEKRQLGETGEMLSIVGMGGIVLSKEEPATAARIVAKAVENRGVNYFDIAPSYGNAQELLGPALLPYRKMVFLACKTTKRSAGESEAELNDSLEKLKTDHVDLYQLHGVKSMDEVDQITGPGGALETFLKARESGKIRFIGFSAHSEEAALTLMDRYSFDTILFPINWVTWNESGFGSRVVEKALGKNMGVLAIKSLAKRKWNENERPNNSKTWYRPVENYDEARLALRFTLSKPVTAAVSPGEEKFFWWACDAADDFTPLTDREEEQIASKAKGLEPIFPQVQK